MPTFLVGFGRPAAEEGIAVDTASEAVASVPDSLDYQSYLMDARYFSVFHIIIQIHLCFLPRLNQEESGMIFSRARSFFL